MRNFINLSGTRLRSSVIKKYKPQGNFKLNVVYNTGEKLDLETFDLKNPLLRDQSVAELDGIFGDTFTNFSGTRIRNTIIKKYYAYGETKIKVVYSASRYTKSFETFDIGNEMKRDELLNDMDETI